MYLRFGLLADAIVMGAAGKKNIIGTFSIVFSAQFPCHHPSLSLVMRIEGNHSENGQHHLEVSFVDADYKEIGKPVNRNFELLLDQVPIPGVPLGFEAVVNITGLPLPKAGSYEFAVKVDGRHIGSVPLHAVQMNQPSPD